MQRNPGARSRNSLNRPQRVLSTTTMSAGVAHTRLCDGALYKMENKQSSSQAPLASVQSRRDPLTRVTAMLEQSLM